MTSDNASRRRSLEDAASPAEDDVMTKRVQITLTLRARYSAMIRLLAP